MEEERRGGKGLRRIGRRDGVGCEGMETGKKVLVFFPEIKTRPLPLTLSDAALRLTYLAKQFTPLTILST